MIEQAKVILNKAGVDKLPSLPHVLLKLLHVLNNENDDFEQLAQLILQDPALYTRFSFIGNLPSNHKNSLNSLEQLLPIIGIHVVKNIINTTAVQQFFSPYSIEKVAFLKQHWRHSILCAELAKLMANHISYKKADEAYIAGLTHDIGQLSLESAFPKKYTSTFAQLSEDENFFNLENEEFGTTHQQVSSTLLKACGINKLIADAALYHHEESNLILDAHPLVKIVSLCNQLSSSDFKKEDTSIFDTADKLFNLSQATVLELLQTAKDTVGSIAINIGIDFKADGADGETSGKIDRNF